MCTIISQTGSHSQQVVTRHHNAPYYFQTFADELSLEILYRCPFSDNDKNVQAASHARDHLTVHKMSIMDMQTSKIAV